MRRTGLLLCVCTALATAAQGAFNGRDIRRVPDMCNLDTVDTVTWYAGESVRLEIEPWRCGERVEIPSGATAAWIVADEGGTNWLVRYDLAPAGGRTAFAFGAGEGNLPGDRSYTGYVSLMDGTNVLGVLDRFEVNVLGMAEDSGVAVVMPPDEYPAIVDAVHEYLLRTTDLASSNAAAVAELRGATNALAAGIATNAADILALQGRADALSTRAAALEGATNSWNAAADAIAPLRAATNALSGRADAADSAIAALRAATNTLSTAAAVAAASILALQASTNALDSRSARLEAATNFLSAGVASNAAAAASLRSATNALAGRVAANESAVAVLRNATNSLHAAAVGHSTAISALQTATNALVARAGRLETATNSLAAGVATNAAAVAALRGATNALDGRVGRLEAATNALAAGVATNAAAISSLRSATNALAARAGKLETATNSLAARIGGAETALGALQSAANALSGSIATNTSAVAALQSATNSLDARVGLLESGPVDSGAFVAVSNGEWTIVQTAGWTGLELSGERVFGAVSGAASNTAARIAGLSIDGDTLVLTFVGADTNRVEACNDRAHWFAWDDCGDWAYTGQTGRVTVYHAEETCWYRVVSAGNAVEWQETAVVSYVPLYLDGALSNSNLAASRSYVDLSISTAMAGLPGRGLPAVGWTDNYDPAPTNVAWSIGNTGSYFKTLSVGGEVQVGEATFQDTGSLSLNGTAISSWDEIVEGHPTVADMVAYLATNKSDLSGYATESWVGAYLATNKPDLSGYATKEWAQGQYLPRQTTGINTVTSRGFDFLHYGGIYASPQRIFFQNAWLLLNGRGITNWSDIVAGYATTDQAATYAADAASSLSNSLSSDFVGLRLAATNAAEDIKILFGHQQANATAISDLAKDVLSLSSSTSGLDGVATNYVPRFSTDPISIQSAGVAFLNANPGGRYAEPQIIGFSNAILQLNGYNLTNWTDLAAGGGGGTTAAVVGAATTNWVVDYVAGLGFLTSHQPLDGYATMNWVSNRGFLTSQALSGYATEDWVAGYVATNHQPLAGYATENYVATWVGGLSNFVSEIAGQGGTGGGDISGFTKTLADLGAATNALDGRVSSAESAITALRNATNALDSAVGNLQTATNALDSAVGNLGDRLDALDAWTNGIASTIADHAGEALDAGSFVAKTNGQWVVVQSPAWNGLELAGERVFGAVAEVTSNAAARIVGMDFDGNGGMVLTFVGAATNHVEACSDGHTWTTWDWCGDWTLDGAVGTVTLDGIDPSFWYRVVTDGAPLEYTNHAVVAYAPLYLGGTRAHANLAASRADVDDAISTALAGYSRDSVPSVGYTDFFNPAPTNVAWSITPRTNLYFRDLNVGGRGYSFVAAAPVTNEDTGVVTTNVTTNTWFQKGSLSLNGDTITNWNDLTDIALSSIAGKVHFDAAGNPVYGMRWACLTNHFGNHRFRDIALSGDGSLVLFAGDMLAQKSTADGIVAVETNTAHAADAWVSVSMDYSGRNALALPSSGAPLVRSSGTDLRAFAPLDSLYNQAGWVKGAVSYDGATALAAYGRGYLLLRDGAVHMYEPSPNASAATGRISALCRGP